jgi:hypothetical protein
MLDRYVSASGIGPSLKQINKNLNNFESLEHM